MRYTLFNVPAGSVIDIDRGKYRITQPDGVRYLLKSIKGPPSQPLFSTVIL